MTAKRKLMWYQFTLRGLAYALTVTAIVLGWWGHRSYCLRQADYHRSKFTIWVGGFATPEAIREMERTNARNKFHLEQEEAYRRAIWMPWERFWIAEAPSSELDE